MSAGIIASTVIIITLLLRYVVGYAMCCEASLQLVTWGDLRDSVV